MDRMFMSNIKYVFKAEIISFFLLICYVQYGIMLLSHKFLKIRKQ